jgi:hypothetical protein
MPLAIINVSVKYRKAYRASIVCVYTDLTITRKLHVVSALTDSNTFSSRATTHYYVSNLARRVAKATKARSV